MIIKKEEGMEIEFFPIGVMWSTYIPEGRTYKVFISVDEKRNFKEFAKETELTGPKVFQCTGYNNRSLFRITGVPDGETIDILV